MGRKNREPLDRRNLALSALLAALAGWVDALAFVHWHGLFVSFMSGNSTKMVTAAAGLDSPEVLQSARAILAFMVGVILGELLRAIGQSRARLLVLAVEAVMLWAASTCEYLGFGEVPVTSLLGGAMGLQNAAVHHAEGISVALTYVTGTLVHLGRAIAEALTGKGSWRATLPYFMLWFGLVLGGFCGAVVTHESDLLAMIAAAIAVSVLAITASLIDRPETLLTEQT